VARADSIFTKGLKKHIDAGKDTQNGYGYDDFVRMMTVPRKPTYSSVGDLFNKDGQTIKKWWMQYLLEQKGKK
jgi:hypothetical protein